ncbi:MAG: MBL fold metallo-hydrolase [Dehalococcoidia bacterium]
MKPRDTRITRRTALTAAGAVAGGLALGANVARAQQGPPVIVRQIGEGVYFFSTAGYNSIFVVTPEGVLVFDPIGLANPNAPTAMLETIRQLTGAPVTHVIYSHDHADHITGGAVFSGARFVSHRLAAPKIAARGDARTPTPTALFDVYLQVDLGGKDMQLFYPGRNHSDNSIILHIPKDRLVMAVDFVPVRTLPFRDLTDSYITEWIDSLAWIERYLDFDTLVPGHGEIGTKADVTSMREYFLNLIDAVSDASNAGLADNSPEMIQYVRARLGPAYGRWSQWETFLPLNIEGVIRDGVA